MAKRLAAVAAAFLSSATCAHGQLPPMPAAPTLPAPPPYIYHDPLIGSSAANVQAMLEAAFAEQRTRSAAFNDAMSSGDFDLARRFLDLEAEAVLHVVGATTPLDELFSDLNRRRADDKDRRHVADLADFSRRNQTTSARSIADDVLRYVRTSKDRMRP